MTDRFPTLSRAATLLAVGLLVGLPPLPAAAGVILDTLQGSTDAAAGWSGGLNGSLSASGGNTERSAWAVGGRLLRRGDADLWRLTVTTERETVDGLETARTLVGHLRQNHRLRGALHSVAFVQVQHNPFQRLQSRWLLGVGARWDLTADARGRLSLGATHMLEFEQIRGEAGHDTDQRLSAFAALDRRLREGVGLTLTAFWQPLWSDWSDRRAMATASLQIDLTGSLTLQTGGGLEYDARPPAGVDTTDWTTVTSLGLKF